MTRHFRRSLRFRAATTGAILMASGRVPMTTSTVLQGGIRRCSNLHRGSAYPLPEDLARGQRDELAVRARVTAPHLAWLHRKAPRPFHAGRLQKARRATHVAGQDVERPADAHDDGDSKRLTVALAPDFFERARHAYEQHVRGER